MRTTLDLPDDLMRAVRLRAVREDRKLKDLVADLLRRGLADGQAEPLRTRHRVQLPLVRCAHRANHDDEMTPERVAELLMEQEARGALLR
jgi:hypothetical protein